MERVRAVQAERFRGLDYLFNSQIPSGDISKFCVLESDASALAWEQYEKLNMTARGFYKLLRVSRTIADMEQSERIKITHFQKALLFRGLDQSYWKLG